MKKLTKISIITLLALFISNCGEKIREEITERHENGNKKTIMKFKGSGSEEVMVEKIVYSQKGDTLIWENYDSKGEREGNWIGYVNDYANSRPVFNGNQWVQDPPEISLIKGNYKDGKLEGKYILYFENGKISQEGNYKDGKLDGKWSSYSSQGTIRQEGNYKDGIEDGEWTYLSHSKRDEYSRKHLTLSLMDSHIKANYKDGKFDGKYTRYYENGQISQDVNYKDGKLDGKYTWYYENGQLKEEFNYKDGKMMELDGKVITYYENGQINEDSNYKDGKEDGKWTEYYKNGQIYREGNYKDGKRDGKWTQYWENGTIRRTY